MGWMPARVATGVPAGRAHENVAMQLKTNVVTTLPRVSDAMRSSDKVVRTRT
jgi:hypothetical protein